MSAQTYREKLPDGTVIGGPALYVQKAFPNAPRFSKFIGKFEAWLVILGYGVACALTQGNTLAGAMQTSFNVPTWVTGIVIAVLVVIIGVGGLKVIGSIVDKMVPFMAILYIATGVIVLLFNITAIPGMFAQIFKCAFTFDAAAAAPWASPFGRPCATASPAPCSPTRLARAALPTPTRWPASSTPATRA